MYVFTLIILYEFNGQIADAIIIYIYTNRSKKISTSHDSRINKWSHCAHHNVILQAADIYIVKDCTA